MSVPDRPVRVLQSVKPPRRSTNPYIVQLGASLAAEPGVAVAWFSWRRAILGRYDVLHAHWPELLVRREGRAAKAAARARFALLLTRLAVDRRIAVVQTLHNIGAHEGGTRVERALLAAFERRTDGWIALNQRTPARRPGAEPAVILHGDYADWYARYEQPPPADGRLVFFGLIRPYKGVDRLLDVFRQLDDPALRLALLGRVDDARLAGVIEAGLRADARVSGMLEYVPDDVLAAEIGRAQLVVLPYEELHNSGALLLALSLGRPVLVPASPTTADLAAEVGEDWVLTYPSPLTPESLAKALADVRGRAPGGAPDLTRRRWPLVAAQHAAYYRTVLSRRRR